MAIDFPNTPANNDIYTVDGVSYIYNEPKTQWKVYTQTQTGQDLASVTTNIVPASNVTYSLGTANNAWSDLYVSGNTIHLGVTQLSVTAEGQLTTTVGNTAVEIGGGSGLVGGGDDQVFLLYNTVVTTDYTIGANTNALSAGPLEIANGASVTISNNATWTIV